jgi:hypothetical protein
MTDKKQAKLIYKSARYNNMFIIEDLTDLQWDVGNKFHKLQVKFIMTDNNDRMTKLILIFIDAEEVRGVFEAIKLGRFEEVFASDKKERAGNNKIKLAETKYFGGSRKYGLSKKRKDGKLVSIINGPESRIFSISKIATLKDNAKENKKFDQLIEKYYKTTEKETKAKIADILFESVGFRFNAVISKGNVRKDNTIGFTNQDRDQLYFDFDEFSAIKLATTVNGYMQSKETIALQRCFKLADSSKKKTIQDLSNKILKLADKIDKTINVREKVEDNIYISIRDDMTAAEADEVIDYLNKMVGFLKKKIKKTTKTSA